MKTFHEQNIEMQKEQESRPGWSGITDIELAKYVYYAIETYLDDDYQASLVNTIAKTIQKHRTY